MLRKSSVTALLVSFSKPQLLKQASKLLSRRFSKIRDTKIASFRSWKYCTIPTASKCASLFTQMVISPMKFTLMWLWTTSRTLCIGLWRTFWKWSKWFHLSSWSFMPISWWELLLTFMRLVYATEISSHRMFSSIQILIYLKCAISEVRSILSRESQTSLIFAPDTTGLLNSSLVTLITQLRLMFGPWVASSQNWCSDNQFSQVRAVLTSLLKSLRY